MSFSDSIDKVIGYFGAVTRVPFSYKGKDYGPHPLIVSPLIFRGFTCPATCGGCCPRFSLDYLPSETKPPTAQAREISFRTSGKSRGVPIFSDLQKTGDHFCANLNREDGRCQIYEIRPFSCDFELIRFLVSVKGDRPNHLTQKLFGRGWAMQRVDGKRGARCEMTPADAATVSEVVRKLTRLKQWCDHFNLVTWLPEIIDWAKTGPHHEPLRLEN